MSRAPSLTTLHQSLTESLPEDFKDFFYNSQGFIVEGMLNLFSLLLHEMLRCEFILIIFTEYFAQLLNPILEISAAFLI